MRVAIVGGPGVGKSTLVRQLADLYHNGSYGEGEKGVWDPRVLEDIANGVNREQAQQEIDQIARDVLSNPVIEDYRVELLD